jgi:hypothetical protein
MTLGSCSVISISILCRQCQRRLSLIDVVTSVSSSFATSYRHFPTRRRIARKVSHSGRKVFPRFHADFVNGTYSPPFQRAKKESHFENNVLPCPSTSQRIPGCWVEPVVD